MAATLRRVVRKFSDGKWGPLEADTLTVEEPMEIRVVGKSLAVIMRTPGDDVALAAGFLVTEGIVRHVDEIGAIEKCDDPEDVEKRNIVSVTLAKGVAFDEDRFKRNFYASSSCGLCGKASISAIATCADPIAGNWQVSPETLLGMPEKLRGAQRVFAQTGSLHAAGLFDLEGNLIDIGEDVGRHNAVDKVIGKAAMEKRLPLDRTMLMVSGRVSFEITQKALMAGIPLIAAVSGASSLSVQLAEDSTMTLAGFLRNGSLVVYHDPGRIKRNET